MKAVISTDGNEVSAHFGRCPEFTLVKLENGSVVSRETIPNPGHHPGYLPQFFRELDAEYIIAGGMGQRAQMMFTEHGIQTIMGVSGRIDDIIDQLNNGSLQGGQSLCSPGAGRGYGLDRTACDHDEHKN